jgi:uncharacterized repeat protein (TIGR04138 family)
MQDADFDAAVNLIRTKDPRYGADAYEFMREALEHTQTGIPRDPHGRACHVTGQQLLAGIREYALARFGPMAMTVLEEWGIHTCPDFGEIVFNMIDQGLLAKTAQDSRADFADGYEFGRAFREPFLPSSKLPPPKRGEKPATAPSR